MTNTDHTKQATAHTAEPWHCDTGFIVAPDPSGQHPDIYIAEIVREDDEGRIAPYEQHEANARRIVTAVNACKGIDTEALERGIIADLRHLLGEPVSAAGDLDAAIDGVTDQFDAERARLNATIHAAQAALDGGMEIDLDEQLAGHRKIAVVWCIEDVQDVRPDLTDEQAWQVLRQVKRNHDADIGVNRYTLEWNAEDLFGDAPETATEQKQS